MQSEATYTQTVYNNLETEKKIIIHYKGYQLQSTVVQFSWLARLLLLARLFIWEFLCIQK